MALAAKLARTAWAVLRSGVDYDRGLARGRWCGRSREMGVHRLGVRRGVNEVDKTGLSLAPWVQVRPGPVLESSCSIECRMSQTIDYPRRSIVIGEVAQMHIREDCLDEAGRYVRPEIHQPLARCMRTIISSPTVSSC